MNAQRIRECECGLTYVRSEPADQRYHRKLHREYTHGPRLVALAKVPIIATLGEVTIHAVTSSVPQEIRTKLSHVAMVAQRSMSTYPAGYDGTVSSEDQRLYVAADNAHAIGMLVTATDSRFWSLAWGEGGSVTLTSEEPLLVSVPKVARVWVAAAHRRKGLALALVRETATHLGVEPASLGWELPFTDLGARVVRAFSRTTFLGSCDGFTLSEVLNAAPR